MEPRAAEALGIIGGVLWQRRNRIRTRRRLAGLPPSLRPLWPYAKRLHTFGVGSVAPITRTLSRLFGGQLPHGVARTADEVVELGEGRVVIARAAQRVMRPVPVGIPPRHSTFAAEADEIIPRVAVAELPRGRVLGPARAIVTGRGTFVDELSPYFGTDRPSQHPVFVDLFAAAPTIVEGRVGVLAARGDVSYYHFLTDVLPRLALLEELDLAPEQLYVPASLSFQQQLIDMLELGPERIIDSDRIRHLEAESLVVPGLPDADLKTPPWVVGFLRERLLPCASQLVPGRRIYITRGTRQGHRIVINEAALVDVLSELGFTIVDPGAMPVAEQIRTFAEAEWIVAPHGGALTNLAFASPGASVIELFAPDYVQGCYWKLSSCVSGLTYRYLVGAGRLPRGSRMLGVDSDMNIDALALVALLDGLPVDSGEQTMSAV